MNLHGIVSGAIGAVNPHTSATLKVSTAIPQPQTDRAHLRLPRLRAWRKCRP